MSSEKLKLLYEYHDANVTIEENLNENKEKVKKYKISGIFSTIGEKKIEMVEFTQENCGKKK